MKVYKCYWLWNNEKVYLQKRDRTSIFVSLKGLKAAITQREKDIKLYKRENYQRTEYFIEEYDTTFSREFKLEN